MIKKLLIANRGEIALRIMRSAGLMGIKTIAVYPKDDANSLHVRRADQAVELPSLGVRAYLNQDAVLDAACQCGADALHPGYGFLSENAEFAERVTDAGLTFIGPKAEILRLLGDKIQATQLATKCAIPTLLATHDAVDEVAALEFFNALPPKASMIIKARSGGGGRGIQIVSNSKNIAPAIKQCQAEALAASGDKAVYAEHYLDHARHIEVQVIGDATGNIMVLGDRDCTLQRRHQKLIEIAPAPNLGDRVRENMYAAAIKLAKTCVYQGLATIEFLFDQKSQRFYFMEANPRLQVEHTVTEAVTGLDIISLQLQVAAGVLLKDMQLEPSPRGVSLQARVNMETLAKDGTIIPTSGTLTAYEPPSGQGVRVDGFAYQGYQTSTLYDGLLAKVIVHAEDLPKALKKADHALAEFNIQGLATNISMLRAITEHPDVQAYQVHTKFIETHAGELIESEKSLQHYAHPAPKPSHSLAVSNTFKSPVLSPVLPNGCRMIVMPLQATLVGVAVKEGDSVNAGSELMVLEAMKMQHVITAPTAGVIQKIYGELGQTLAKEAPLLAFEINDMDKGSGAIEATVDLDARRADLQEVLDRKAYGLDENRPEAMAKRRLRGGRMARENIAILCDEGTFNEYGAFAVAAQRARRDMDDLVKNTSGDGIITGTGQVNGSLFGAQSAGCAFAIGDYSVLAGTQGYRHHQKLDRIFDVAENTRSPLIFFAEGGGGRPGDTDTATVAGLDVPSFARMAKLSGLVPVVGVVAGRCFAGNAALLGCCDVIIATENSNIGMAGPAMIEGGGLGVYKAEDVGPINVQTKNGVVDIRVKDEAEACTVAKQYLSFFQGALAAFEAPDGRLLRHAIPENRLRVYDIHAVINGLADLDSVLELRAGFGVGMITALVRIAGTPYGLIANNPAHLGGAIDADGADKAARFMQLCQAHELPIISLCDTPGFMVGPEAEATGLVRHVSRLFVTAASLSVPVFSIILRKGYGLGVMAMTGGGFKESVFTVAWPTGEFGAMGLEGAVKLGFTKELDAINDEAEKQAKFEVLLAKYYAEGKAVSFAASLEIDAVIDPLKSRAWIENSNALNKGRITQQKPSKPFIDTW